MRHRFHALCSYFAMFPESFAEHWIQALTEPGDSVLDPFCGRGTAPFQALLMGRRAIGCDTNAVAYCVSSAKTNAPPLTSVLRRIDDLESEYDRRRGSASAAAMPEFFQYAYHPETLRQLLHLRRTLNYRKSVTDRMLTALVLGSLHGEADRSTRFLSNQMPHTISTKPGYSVRFWRSRKMVAPERDAFELLRAQAKYRYESGRPVGRGEIFHLDMRDLPRHADVASNKSIRCVITSPPYFDVTNYAEDQWLRLWFLNGAPYPDSRDSVRDDRHGTLDKYWMLLADMWRSLGLILARKSSIVIRLGAARIGPDRLVSGLEGVARASGRRVRLVGSAVSEISGRQTDSFRPGSTGCKLEVDCHFQMV